jgi:hypothetical protein
MSQPLERQPDAHEQSIIQEAVQQDRLKLFTLADKVSERAITRRWDTLVVDGGRGLLVGEFLLAVLSEQASARGSQEPNMITIANSRHIAGWGHRRQHRHSALEYMRAEEIGSNALVVTDMVDSGSNLRRLGGYTRALGVRSDFAILTAPASERELRRKISAPSSSEVYYVQHNEEPYLAGDTITQGLGLYTEFGDARMQPHPHHWDWLEQPIRDAFDQLAVEYLGQEPSA